MDYAWVEPKVVELIAKHGRADIGFREEPKPLNLLQEIARAYGLRLSVFGREARFTRNPPENDLQAHAHLGEY